MRTFELLVRGLAAPGNAVDAVFVQQDGQEQHRESLQQFLRHIRYCVHRSGRVRAVARLARSLVTAEPYANLKFTPATVTNAVREMLATASYDAVIVEHQHAADAVLRATSARVVVDMHNVYSDLYARVASTGGSGLKGIHSRIQRRFAAKQEQRLGAARALLVVSEEDAESMRRAAVTAPLFIVPNGVDTEFFRPGAAQGALDGDPWLREPLVTMTGSMDYFPNSDGAAFLVREVMPLVWAKRPGCRVAIVGRAPGRSVRALRGDPRVQVTGGVPDVRPFLERASVAVVPLRSGSGSRLKALEAASMGKAIVGTSIGLEGIPFADGRDVLVRDTPRAFADAILDLLDDQPRAEALGRQARTLVEQDFSWTRCRHLLQEALREIVALSDPGTPRGLDATNRN